MVWYVNPEVPMMPKAEDFGGNQATHAGKGMTNNNTMLAHVYMKHVWYRNVRINIPAKKNNFLC